MEALENLQDLVAESTNTGMTEDLALRMHMEMCSLTYITWKLKKTPVLPVKCYWMKWLHLEFSIAYLMAVSRNWAARTKGNEFKNIKKVVLNPRRMSSGAGFLIVKLMQMIIILGGTVHMLHNVRGTYLNYGRNTSLAFMATHQPSNSPPPNETIQR
eukprot:CAMPEP_0113624792 /NCGR_PEP_ID=MMETSP0017_2-20120614/12792_1 /TAXON_ID=2856 /ORGANISM="Cylindrotheca closterium" /LENGTH=156 /DNA_ID=CAMNT_0000534857 /DNA_START=409 /DNA_END=879 /DNA_ORIENTATION=- /assembly_acc=CAM_ASM_000147